MSRQHVGKLTAITTAVVVGLATLVECTSAATQLKSGSSYDGFVQATSPSFQFINPKSGSRSQTARGQEFTFSAKKGERIAIAIDPEDGSALKPVLVLLDPNKKQVGYSEAASFIYQIPVTGTYRLLVLGLNNTRGRYTLVVNSVGTASAPTAGTQSQADQIMRNELKLRIIGCGVPNVARIKIGNDERCTRDIEPGQYVYDSSSKSIKLVDTRRDLLAQRLQITVLERCPANPATVAQIVMNDPQDGKDYTYCATPTRFVKAGAYRYDVLNDDLKPIAAAQVPAPAPTPAPTSPQTVSTSVPDARRQVLQADYGLSVLDNCPAARSSLVVVTFPETDQSYVYCARPNRVVVAGEYTYNAQTGNLDPARQPAPQCTVSVGGICIVK
jgi:hypothetical protein